MQNRSVYDTEPGICAIDQPKKHTRANLKKNHIHQYQFTDGKSGSSANLLRKPKHCVRHAVLRHSKSNDASHSGDSTTKSKQILRKGRREQTCAVQNGLHESMECSPRNDRSKSTGFPVSQNDTEAFDFAKMREILDCISMKGAKRDGISREIVLLIEKRRKQQDALAAIEVFLDENEEILVKVPEEGRQVLIDILRKVKFEPRHALNFSKKS